MTERLKLRVIPSQRRLRADAIFAYHEQSADEHDARCAVAWHANFYSRLANG